MISKLQQPLYLAFSFHCNSLLSRNHVRNSQAQFNPFRPSAVKWLHFKVYTAILVQPILLNFFDIRALWCSGLSAGVPECQKIKRVG